MNRRRIQRVAAVHAQEARALLKRLRPQLRHLLELRAGGDAVFVAIGDDVVRQRLADARHVRQQRRGGRLHIHADARNAAFHHAGERVFQLRLLQIVLILPHADGLRVDLHQLGQRVLHAPRDGNRASERDVVFRKFLRRQLGGGIHARARLADDDVGHARRFRQQGGDELLALAGGRAIADGDGRDPVAANHAQNLRFRPRLLRLVIRQGEIAHAGFQHLARLIHNRQLAARTEARIDAQRDLAANRRLHQKLVQVVAEDADRALVRLVRQLVSDFAL